MSEPDQRMLAVEKTHEEVSMATLLSQILQISEAQKENPMHMVQRYMRVAMGPGKLSPDDFMRLRLFDSASVQGASLMEFVGAKRYRDICITVNYRNDWMGMLSNKVASSSYLAYYGLPGVATKAVYMPRLGRGSEAPVLGSAAELDAFLLDINNYPLFCKPIESQNSLGAAALMKVLPATRELVASDGASISIDTFIAEITAQYPEGYLFQALALAHPAISAVSGGRLATVRFFTIVAEDGPHLFRACMKIPAGENAADNYWREGNLLAQLDMETGRIMRVTSGHGLKAEEHTTHPDTGAALIGFVHPQWQEMRALALRGAALMHQVSMIGWDIACTAKGPVIIEMNELPDSFLMQYADRRGLLDDTFNRFVAFQTKNRDVYLAELRSRGKHI